MAGPGAGYGESDAWIFAPLPLPSNGHITCITTRDVGDLATKESVGTTIMGLTVGRTYELVIYTMSAITDDYSPQYIDHYRYQLDGYPQQW